MYHTTKFNGELTVDLEVSPKRPLERLRTRKGTQIVSHMKPFRGVRC